MSIEDFIKNMENRVSELGSAVDKSAQLLNQASQALTQNSAQHHALLGTFSEAKAVLDMAKSLSLPGVAGTIVSALDAADNMAINALNSTTAANS